MFVYDPTKNFNLSKVAHSIGIEGDVSTPTASYALPWVQNYKDWVSAGMGQITTSPLILGALAIGGLFLAAKLFVVKRHSKQRKHYRKALKRALA